MNMESTEIELRDLRNAINSVLDHLIEDLSLEELKIDPSEDYYWECPAPDVYESSKRPDLVVGRLSDDVHFSRLIDRAGNGAASYNLVHIAPLLRYIGEKVKR